MLNASGVRNGTGSALKSILNKTNKNAGNNTNTAGSRRKSVEFDLALRSTTVSERQSKPMPFSSMLQNVQNMSGNPLGGIPIPQPRKSLMFANQSLDPQSLYGVTQAQAPGAPPSLIPNGPQMNAQLYQNQAQLQYQILQHHLQQQQMQAAMIQQGAGSAIVQQVGMPQALMPGAAIGAQQQQQLQQVQAANQLAIQNQLAAQQMLQQAARKPRPLVRHNDGDHL